MKSNPDSLEKLREKERNKYLKKKEKGQVKPIAFMSPREKILKRKNWRKNNETYRIRKNISLIYRGDIPPPSTGGQSC